MKEKVTKLQGSPVGVRFSGADPGFLDRGFKFTKWFDLFILCDYLLIFPDFSENSE